MVVSDPRGNTALRRAGLERGVVVAARGVDTRRPYISLDTGPNEVLSFDRASWETPKPSVRSGGRPIVRGDGTGDPFLDPPHCGTPGPSTYDCGGDRGINRCLLFLGSHWKG